jgi:hypothetical protein
MSERPRPTAIDFATHNVWGDPLSEDERNECVDTIRDLVEAFGPKEVIDAVSQCCSDGPETINSSNAVQCALRNMASLIVQDDKPRLTANLVGRLCGSHLAAGIRLSLRELGRLNNMSKQAVQNRMKTIAAKLSLPLPDSTPKQRESHRLMNRRNYGSRPVIPATIAAH